MHAVSNSNALPVNRDMLTSRVECTEGTLFLPWQTCHLELAELYEGQSCKKLAWFVSTPTYVYETDSLLDQHPTNPPCSLSNPDYVFATLPNASTDLVCSMISHPCLPAKSCALSLLSCSSSSKVRATLHRSQAFAQGPYMCLAVFGSTTARPILYLQEIHT